MHDDLQLRARDKVVQRMTRNGLVEENLSKGTSQRVSARLELDEDSFTGEKPVIASAEVSPSRKKMRKRRYAAQLRDTEVTQRPAPEPSQPADTDDSQAEEQAAVSQEIPQKTKQRSHLTDQALRSEARYHREQTVSAKHQQHKKQVLTEQAKQKQNKLRFDDEPVTIPERDGVLRKTGSVLGTAVHSRVSEAEQDNMGVEAAHKSEMAAEGAARHVRSRLSDTSRVERHRTHGRSNSYTHEAERPASKLKFDADESELVVQKPKMQKVQQKRQLKRRYAAEYKTAHQTGQRVASASAASKRSFRDRIRASATRIVKNNKGIFVAAAGGLLAVVFFIGTFGAFGSLISGTTNSIVETTYLSSDEDIHAVENDYAAMEADLQAKIDNIEQTYPGYDEYEYQVDEISHNPYQLISYFTAKYGDFTYDQVKDELKEIFEEQYKMTTSSDTRTETVTRTVRVGESLGSVVTSGYCSCRICCGQWAGGPTASGVYPTADHTIAVDAYNPFVPLGTHIIMNGVEYVVEDTGNFARYGVQFDVYYTDHSTALQHGHQTWEAYLADSNGSNHVEVTETKTIRRLRVTVPNSNLDLILRNRMNSDQQQAYSLYNATYGNRDYLFPTDTLPLPDGMSYEIPPEALSDAKFAAMIHEAEKYLGYPYVWGGSSPSTSFDCSGFVSWVVNHCGLGWDYGRLGAEGLRNQCTYVSPSDAKPGDLIFFQNTYDAGPGASHCGIYVGNGMMIHCGNPIQYASIETNYWQSHFLYFGRLPEP